MQHYRKTKRLSLQLRSWSKLGKAPQSKSHLRDKFSSWTETMLCFLRR